MAKLKPKPRLSQSFFRQGIGSQGNGGLSGTHVHFGHVAILFSSRNRFSATMHCHRNMGYRNVAILFSSRNRFSGAPHFSCENIKCYELIFCNLPFPCTYPLHEVSYIRLSKSIITNNIIILQWIL